MADRPLDRIHIRDLQCRCVLGVNPDERRNKQDVVIDITLYADLAAAGRSDDLRDTVNYRAVKKQVLEMVEASSFHLVERLAERVAEICLAPPPIRLVRVLVEKPGALRFARTVGVEITRAKDEADYGGAESP